MLKIDGYEILTQIYESSNSHVYRGIRQQDNQPVILKFLKEDYPTPSELTRYKQEYEITRNLNLEGVIKAYELKPYQMTFCIILEDFGASSLKQLMNQGREAGMGAFPLEEFLSIAIKIVESLSGIHTANIIHKDINPANIIYNQETDQLKIIDFGISTQFNRENPTLKNPNVLEGTLAYISPEQTGRMNRSLDYRTDFYSLGVTFYELLTGKLPFETNDALELVHCHIAKVPITPHQVNPEIPKAVSEIVMKLMAKTAEERYQSAFGIRNDLGQCWQQLETTGNILEFTLGIQDISEHFHIPQKLYGRETEVETLLTAFERVANPPESPLAKGGLGGVEMMLVAGYSGIGKSSLVAEIHKPNTRLRGYFTEGKFDQFQKSIPYSAVVNAFKGLVRQLLTESEAQLEQWREKLSSAFGINGQVIIDVIPEVELIVGQQPPVPELGASESQNRFNIVFGNFIRAFCTKEHPLVIFLDDLQWADSATLKLIELMMTDTDMQYLFLIGAYRDNEVSPSHPLIITLDGLLKGGATINYITLSPLALENISQLMADTLYRDTDSVKPLAELVMTKTGGNPFFVNQFLKTLHAENLIAFIPPQSLVAEGINPPQSPLTKGGSNSAQSPLTKGGSKGGFWQWNIAQIEVQNITDNVVELMTGKLKKLPELTQKVLRLASCIGASFSLSTLAIVSEKTKEVVFSDLVVAVQNGFILPTSELDENLLIQDYKFLHDRVQQAAYTMIPELEKQENHLKIGKQLLEKSSQQQREEKIFEIVNNLNLSRELISTQSDKDELAKLNLIAGKKAKAATAYNAAFQYLNLGIKLLSADSWQSQYHLTLSLYSEAVETSYLNGNYEEMEKIAEIVLKQAKTLLEKVKIYEVKMQTSMAKVQQLEALKIGLEVLNLMGISLPKSPTSLDIQQALLNTNNYLQGKTIDDLLNLPLMTDAEQLATMGVLRSTIPPTYQAAPALFPLIVLSMVNLSIQYGNSVLSPFGYICYAVILHGVLLEINSAYEFGNLALMLVDKLNSLEVKTEIHFIAGACTIYGKVHAKETLPLLVKGYESGLENGHFEFGGYAAMQKGQHSYFIGRELTEISAEIAIISHSLAQLKQNNALIWNQIFQQAVFNLLNTANNPCLLIGEAYNEQECLPILQQANDRTGLHYFYVNKLILCYLFEDDQQALENSRLAANYLDGVTAFLVVPVFHFYDSLVRLVLYPFVPNTEQNGYFNKVQANQEKMQIWAAHAPMNFQHKFDLVEAEKCRVLGQKLEAMDLYDRAIQGAKENNYINEAAIAYELAAKFYLSQGKELTAKAYMQEANYFYELWGATAKVKHLQEKFPQLLISRSTTTRIKNTTTTRTTTGTNAGATLDFATVIKASQVLAGEIAVDKLLAKLMTILLENGGAQKGFLILSNQGKFTIEATGEVAIDQVQVSQSLAVEDCENLPLGVVQYVARTQEDVVLSDAKNEGLFTKEPYIVENHPKSILCAPIINQGKLIGILYLENNLTTGAFTQDRLEILKVLSSQAAISLENALLYRTLEAKVTERTAQLAEANQEISTLNEMLKKDNIRMGAELDIVKRLQQMVLPRQSELAAIEGLEIAGFMEPADEVGGDYYDVLKQNGNVKISIGDVTGHGLESGVLMIMAQTAIRTLEKMKETNPVKFLDVVNQTLYDNLARMKSSKNMTLAILDYTSGIIKLSGQHEEIIVVRGDGTLECIDTMELGFPIGLEAEIGDFIAQQEIPLNPGDVMVLYTDGITEAINMNKVLYGLERLCEVVVENRHGSAEEIKQVVIDDVRKHIGSQKVFDDITLVVMKQK
jgi:predicted ATPase/serine phosphatase RsbU (regulator of sigma subunit)/tRNA A-37 threonylcarbamoyl transferase component Bud32